MKTALILEGGGVRGIFSAGVLDVFLEKNIKFDVVVGVSAGALFGVNYLSGQLGRALRYNKRFNRDYRYMGLYPLIAEGNIVSTDYAYNRVPHELDIFDNEAYKKSPTKMHAVVTNVHTGEPEYIRIDDVFAQMDSLRASGSMPGVSKPVVIGDHLYLDGGISDSIPFEWALERGYEKVVVILTRDIDYRKKPTSKLMADLLFKKYPEVYKKMMVRHENYNNKVDRLIQLEREKKVFILRPSAPLGVGRLERNVKKIQSAYDRGQADARMVLEEINIFLQ